VPISVERIEHHSPMVEVQLDLHGPGVDVRLPELGADGRLAVRARDEAQLVVDYKFEARGQQPSDPDAVPPWATFAGTPTVRAIDSDGLSHTPRLTGRRFNVGFDGDGDWSATLSGIWTFVPAPRGRFLDLTITFN
jgi:hypothetical protein